MCRNSARGAPGGFPVTRSRCADAIGCGSGSVTPPGKLGRGCETLLDHPGAPLLGQMKPLRLRRSGRLHLREPGIEHDQIDPAEIAGERARRMRTQTVCDALADLVRAGRVTPRSQAACLGWRNSFSIH